MDKMQRHKQREIEMKIMQFVRYWQNEAPVTIESIVAFLRNTAGVNVSEAEVRDRLNYLSAPDIACMEESEVWDGARIKQYKILARGMDILDGRREPL